MPTEAARHDSLDRWQRCRAAALASTGSTLTRSVELEPANEPDEVIGARLAPLDEHDVEVGSVDGDDESRDTAAATEVEHRSGGRRQGTDECPGVVDDVADRTSPQHPEPLRDLERLERARRQTSASGASSRAFVTPRA